MNFKMNGFQAEGFYIGEENQGGVGMAENIEKKNKTAVALEYSPQEPAPKIIAVGKGYVAEKIIQSASENKIPVHKDEKLAGTLSKLNIGDYIPPQLYEVVAEILIFVDDMDRIKGKVMPKE